MCVPTATGQDVEEKVKTIKQRLATNPIQFYGGFNFNANFSQFSGDQARRDPFNTLSSAFLTADILDVKLPMSITYSNGSTLYNLPSFTFASLRPEYKWIRLHLLQSSMQFSKYTLNGHGFNGVGVELSPGNWRLQLFTGRLRKERLEDYGLRRSFLPQYRRTGAGMKFGYEDGSNNIFLILFKAKDQEDVFLSSRDSLGINPHENMQYALQANKVLNEQLAVRVDFSYSIFSEDHRNEPKRSLNGLQKLHDIFIPFTNTTYAATAYQWGIDWKPTNVGTISLAYERVAPGFRNLGSLQFQNNFENITIGIQTRIRKFILIHSRLGFERNGLKNFELESRNRFVGMIQASAPINEKINASLQYSNFSNTIRVRDNSDAFELVDSLILANRNNLFNARLGYNIQAGKTLQVTYQTQQAQRIIDDVIDDSGNTIFSNVHIHYQYRPKDKKWGYGFGCGLNQNRKREVFNLWNLRLQGQAQYKIRDDWNLRFHLSHANGLSSGDNSYSTVVRVSNDYRLKESHALRASISLINRRSNIRAANRFTEVLGQIGYTYTFKNWTL